MEHREYRLAAIMYTDISGFSRMMEQDEDATLEMLSYHNNLISSTVADHHGQIIKSIGDAFLASFNNTFDAVKCAVQIQHELASYNSTKQRMQLLLRIGIHLGDIYFFENDALGEGINIASRLQSVTKPGRICISKEVFNTVSNKLELQIAPLGKVNLKNITRDIYAYEIITESSMDYEDGERLYNENRSEETDTASRRPPRPEETPIDFNELKDLVIDQIRHAGRRMKAENIRAHMPEHAKQKVSHVLRKLEQKGYLTKLEKANGQVSYALSHEYQNEKKHPGRRGKDEKDQEKYEAAPFLLFRQYRKRIETQAEKERNGFRGHLISFLLVNGFLFVINMITGGGFPWFLFPLGGWGIGLISHLNSVRLLLKQSEELKTMPELLPMQLKILKKIHKLESNFSSHLVSNVAVAFFLFMINMITSPGFPWFLFPTVGMGIGVISHWFGYSGKIRKLKKELKQQIQQMPMFTYTSDASSNQHQGIVQQAINLKAAITSQVKSMGKDNTPLGEDMLPLLDNYIEQIKELAQKNQEIETVIKGFPSQHLEKDNAELKKKYEETDSDLMKKEYNRSIQEIEKQIHSFNELKNQKELITLRLNSAVNSLKQMQIDLARMRGISASGELSSVSLIREKSQELSHYLTDLESSYRELEE